MKKVMGFWSSLYRILSGYRVPVERQSIGRVLNDTEVRSVLDAYIQQHAGK